MVVTEKVLECILRELPQGTNVIIIPETADVNASLGICLDIMKNNMDINADTYLDSWR
jgi:hypothetical protein